MSTLIEIRKQLHAYEFNVINEKIEELSNLINSVSQRLSLIEQTADFEKLVSDSVVNKKVVTATRDEVESVNKILETINDTAASFSDTIPVVDVPTEEVSTATVDDKKTKVRKSKNIKK